MSALGWVGCGIGGLSMAAAYLVPLCTGQPLAKVALLGLGWQMFLLTLVSILWPGVSGAD
jgi:hypothetical protein